MTTHSVPPPGPSPSLTALVVEPTSADLTFAISTLSLAGFQVMVAEDFREARALLDLRPPTVLVTETRLDEYNGLHLVLRGRTLRPSLAAVVTSAWQDTVLQAEAESLGATFVHKPTTREEFVAAVMRTCYRSSGPEGLEAIRAPFERRHANRRAAVEVEYVPERRVAGRVSSRRRDESAAASAGPALPQQMTT